MEDETEKRGCFRSIHTRGCCIVCDDEFVCRVCKACQSSKQTFSSSGALTATGINDNAMPCVAAQLSVLYTCGALLKTGEDLTFFCIQLECFQNFSCSWWSACFDGSAPIDATAKNAPLTLQGAKQKGAQSFP